MSWCDVRTSFYVTHPFQITRQVTARYIMTEFMVVVPFFKLVQLIHTSWVPLMDPFVHDLNGLIGPIWKMAQQPWILSLCISQSLGMLSGMGAQRDVMRRPNITVAHDLPAWPCMSYMKWVLKGLWGKNTDKEGTTQEGRQRSGVFINIIIIL